MRLSSDIEEYSDLNPDLFETLNRQSHEVVHFLFRYYVNDEAIMERLTDFLKRMKDLCSSEEL